MTSTFSSFLLRVIALCASMLLALSCFGKYTVYKFSAPVKVVRAGNELPVTKDMELRSNDRVIIGEGGEMQILNSFDKSISITGKPGNTDVLSIILNAANDNPNVIGSAKKPKDTVQHMNAVGGTTRGDFDPYLGNLNPHMLGAALMNIFEGKAPSADMPLEVKAKYKDGFGEYTIANTSTAPVYFNVLTITPDSLSASPIGQEIGCFVLNPGQGITRFGVVEIDCDNKTVLVMAAGYFNVAELLGCIRENEQSPLGRPTPPPAAEMPVSIFNIK